jgi:membrane protein DedA with SNARE-associated domain
MDFLEGAFAQHLAHYGYGAIFLIVMIESAGIPMPGETILVSAAAYAGTRHVFDIRFVIAAAAAGARSYAGSHSDTTTRGRARPRHGVI